MGLPGIALLLLRTTVGLTMLIRDGACLPEAAHRPVRRSVIAGSFAFHITATRVALGTASFRSPSRLALSSVAGSEIPVMFPPGWARLATRPVAFASPGATTTIGIVDVAPFAASAAARTWFRPTGLKLRFCHRHSRVPQAPVGTRRVERHPVGGHCWSEGQCARPSPVSAPCRQMASQAS